MGCRDLRKTNVLASLKENHNLKLKERNKNMNTTQIDIIDYFLKQASRYLQFDGNYNGTYFPGIQRITYSGKKTIVWFTDGTKVDVDCSDNDKYDRQTAIAYAICKRLFGKVTVNGTIDAAGFGSLMKKFVDSGFDQDKAKAESETKKREAHEAHVRRQVEAQEAAFQRKVRARAEEIKIEEAARKLLAEQEASKAPSKKILTEDGAKGKCACSKTSSCSTDDYVRPNKPFSQFTPEEKREYWNWYYHAKRKQS